MLPYRYQSLQHADSIRILVLHPSLNLSDPIICTIRPARLAESANAYEALSYTWEDITQKQAIKLHNGRRELLIGKNCCNALRRLRPTQKERLLWIDAICINQEDLTERARQVRLMNDVYSLASRVVVFLGEQVTECRALFKELAEVDGLLRLDKEIKRPSPCDSIVQELEALLELPWFKRVWVLQEVSGKVTFLYGSATTSFSALSKLSFGYKNYRVTKKVLPLSLRWIVNPPGQFSTPQYNLWNCLYRSRDYLATNPRDRVFALKSLVGKDQSQVDSLINYAQSVEECYIDVATFLLPVLGLRLLSAIRHPHDKKMPSWVPDWSQNLPLDYGHFNNEDAGRRYTLAHAHSFSYTIRSMASQNKQSCLELIVPGVRYARIVGRSEVFNFSDPEDAEMEKRKLCCSLSNLKQFVDVECKYDDLSAINLDKAVSDGKQKVLMI
jgi:hypothetical protein